MDKKTKSKNEDIFLTGNISEDVSLLEQYIKQLNEFLPMPVCFVTPVSIIVDANRALIKLSGYEEMDLIGQKFDLLFSNKKKAGDIIEFIKKNKELKNREMVLITRGGREIPVSLSAAIRKDDDNNILGYFISISDISEFKKLQDSLEDKVKERTHELEETQQILIKTLDEVKQAKREAEKERNKTSAIIANFLDPVIVVDMNWRVILYNPAAQKIFKLNNDCLNKKIENSGHFSVNSFKNIINVPFRVKETKYGEDNYQEEMIVSDVTSGKEDEQERKSPFSAAMDKYNPGEMIFKVSTAKIYDKDNICLGRMKIFNDLTREKMIDMLKSEFISIAAHQLRTPLSAIKWSIKMVLDGDAGELKEEQKKILLKGYASNERVINLINEMLNVSRIEEGKFGYVFTKQDIEKLINESIASQKDQIESKKLKVTFKKESILPKLDLDKEKTELAFKHLLENAVKYTPEFGTIKIIIKKDKKNINIKIKDNGIGIPKKDQKKLFTKFFRAENVVHMQTEGSGLGLYIVKNIVEKQGGKIEFKSQEGIGTEFNLSFPIDGFKK